jgi:hypothetical protein
VERLGEAVNPQQKFVILHIRFYHNTLQIGCQTTRVEEVSVKVLQTDVVYRLAPLKINH